MQDLFILINLLQLAVSFRALFSMFFAVVASVSVVARFMVCKFSALFFTGEVQLHSINHCFSLARRKKNAIDCCFAMC